MPELIIVKQDSQFQIEFWAQNAKQEKPEFQRIGQITQLSPHSMMLASLAACTSIVMHSYAQHHHLDLKSVEMHMRYERVHSQDCNAHEHERPSTNSIHEEVILKGKLSEEERQKLMVIAHACPIYQMLKGGITIHSILLSTP